VVRGATQRHAIELTSQPERIRGIPVESVVYDESMQFEKIEDHDPNPNVPEPIHLDHATVPVPDPSPISFEDKETAPATPRPLDSLPPDHMTAGPTLTSPGMAKLSFTGLLAPPSFAPPQSED
jgi:hypothetical protein